MCEAYHILLYRDEQITFSSEGQIMKTCPQIKQVIPFLHLFLTQIYNPPVLVTVMSKIKQIIYEHIREEGHHKSTGYHRACATVPKVTLFGLRLTRSIFIID